jgi:hypothetical protein
MGLTVTSAAAPLLAAMTERTSGSAALMRPLQGVGCRV